MPQDFTAAQVLTAAQMDTLSGAVDGYATTATAAGTTTLTFASMFQQFFTGATTQTVVMPVASTCYVGWKIRIVNNSSGVVTVQSSGANTIYAVPAGGDVIFTCILASGTTAASWDYKNYISSASSPGLVKVLSATFSAVADTGTSFDGVFTSTYKRYLVVSTGMITSGSVELRIQLRVAGVTKATNYYGTNKRATSAGTDTRTDASNAATCSIGSGSTTIPTAFSLYFTKVGNASEKPAFYGNGSSGADSATMTMGFSNESADTYTGLIVSTASGTVSGTITVYGLAD